MKSKENFFNTVCNLAIPVALQSMLQASFSIIDQIMIAPFKVLNMIIGGGIIRSGGKTKYVMMIDIIGTWLFGVPLGLLTAFVLNLSIPYVYFILSLEECVRFGISLIVFRRKKWMHSLEADMPNVKGEEERRETALSL